MGGRKRPSKTSAWGLQVRVCENTRHTFGLLSLQSSHSNVAVQGSVCGIYYIIFGYGEMLKGPIVPWPCFCFQPCRYWFWFQNDRISGWAFGSGWLECKDRNLPLCVNFKIVGSQDFFCIDLCAKLTSLSNSLVIIVDMVSVACPVIFFHQILLECTPFRKGSLVKTLVVYVESWEQKKNCMITWHFKNFWKWVLCST